MSVYINGMEMPTRCEDCFCYWHNAEYDYAYCTISSMNVRGHGNARLVGCPLVPVPDHGDLIDRDALIIALETQDYSCAPNTLEEWTPMDMTRAEIADISNAPTIIPADKDGDGGA